MIYPLTYDLRKDFESIGLISINPQLLVGKKTLPADAALLDHARHSDL